MKKTKTQKRRERKVMHETNLIAKKFANPTLKTKFRPSENNPNKSEAVYLAKGYLDGLEAFARSMGMASKVLSVTLTTYDTETARERKWLEFSRSGPQEFADTQSGKPWWDTIR